MMRLSDGSRIFSSRPPLKTFKTPLSTTHLFPSKFMERPSSPAAVEDGDRYTKDGSVDLQGNPVLRSSRGGWRACSFLVAYEVFERMAYYGITSNLVLYLTRKLHQGTVAAANNVTNWTGTGFLLPVVGAYIADAYAGRYWTFVFSSVIYFMGMCLLTLAVSVPALKPPRCNDINNCQPASTLQLGVFFGALYILAIGTGGAKANISTIGADQFDDFDPKERAHKISFFNWWMFSIYLGTLFANIILVYIQDNIGFALGYGIPTIGVAIAVLIFLAGTPFYRHKLPRGSPLTRMTRVLVSSLRKWRLKLPKDLMELHELDSEEYTKKGHFRILPTDSMRLLSKAAVKIGPSTPWMLCTVTNVEETKQMLRMISVFVAMFIPATMTAQVNTLFVKQGTTLNRHIGPQFQFPAGSLSSFVTISMLISIVVYARYFVKFVRQWTKNPRGITLLQRLGVGLVLHILIMLVASLTEKRRLSSARNHGVVQNGGEVPLSIFILLPQFVLMGISEAFLVVGKIDFFYNQAPESMKSLGTSFSQATYGVGNFLSSVLLKAVADITKRGGHKGWILNNLNASRLDHYYMFLAVLGVLNYMFFLLVCKLYVYKVETFEMEKAKGKCEDEELKAVSSSVIE